jgi:SSS family solute:Na+ symporter
MAEIIHLSIWDWIPLILYLFFLIWIGFRRSSSLDEEHFILSARKLTLPAFVATLVSTWYGGILGVGEFTYLYGISNWFVFGVPYYIFGFIFARFLVPHLKKENILTIPDIFEHKYGKTVGVVSGIFVYILTNPAPYVLMSGLILQYILPIPLWWSLIIVGIVSSAYLVRGGFSSVVKTDILQFILMFAGFIFILIFAMAKLGNPISCWNKLPEVHKSITGGNSWAYIMVWYIMAIVTLVDPNFYQRVFAAKNIQMAQKGIYISIGFWFVFDMLTTWTGLYARAYFSITQPVLTYPVLADRLLPGFFKGLFVVSLLATIMSSMDSFFFSAAVTLGRDIISRLWKVTNYYPYFLASLFITIFLSILIAGIWPSVIQIWYGIATIAIPPLIFPLILSFWFHYQPDKKILIISMIMSSGIVTLDLLLAYFHKVSGSYLLPGMEPLLLGILLNIILFSVSWLINHLRQ